MRRIQHKISVTVRRGDRQSGVCWEECVDCWLIWWEEVQAISGYVSFVSQQPRHHTVPPALILRSKVSPRETPAYITGGHHMALSWRDTWPWGRQLTGRRSTRIFRTPRPRPGWSGDEVCGGRWTSMTTGSSLWPRWPGQCLSGLITPRDRVSNLSLNFLGEWETSSL